MENKQNIIENENLLPNFLLNELDFEEFDQELQSSKKKILK